MHKCCIVVLHLKPMNDGWTLLVCLRQIVQFLDAAVAGIALGLLHMLVKCKTLIC